MDANKKIIKLEYIDALKGIAIFLVVFDHVIAWSYQNFDQSDKAVSFLWSIIYSFHMPLFFFISGYLAFFSFSRNTPFSIIKERTVQLLLPYISSTIIVELLFDGRMNYWFLITLYQIYMLMTISRICKWINPIFLYTLIILLMHLFPSLYYIRYLQLGHLENSMFYYVLGYMLCKHTAIFEQIKKSSYPYCLFVFVLLFAFKSYSNINLTGGGDFVYYKIMALSAIVFMFRYFEITIKENMKRFRFLCIMGKNTLQIYIIHVLFKYAIPHIGDLINAEFQLLTQLAYAVPISIILIYISMFLNKILIEDRIISIILMGYKKPKQ